MHSIVIFQKQAASKQQASMQYIYMSIISIIYINNIVQIQILGSNNTQHKLSGDSKNAPYSICSTNYTAYLLRCNTTFLLSHQCFRLSTFAGVAQHEQFDLYSIPLCYNTTFPSSPLSLRSNLPKKVNLLLISYAAVDKRKHRHLHIL